ncbi:ATP-binding cassette domain-containing protein [Mycolicibacterium setense]
MFTFRPGKDIVIGRGVDADIRVEVDAKQAISREHMILTARNGQWIAEDKSRNGIYVGGTRQARVPIDDDVAINLGAPTGPRLRFRITTQAVPVARNFSRPMPAPAPPARPSPTPQRTVPPPPTQRPTPPPMRPAPPVRSGPPQQRPAPRPPAPTQAPSQPPRHTPPPPRPAGPQPTPRPMPSPKPIAAAADDDDVLARMTGVVKKVLPQRAAPALPAGAITIGRHSTSAIQVDDPLASRVHAYLLASPTGTQIHDNASNNGIFVNGVRMPAATLRPGDVVTIGNTDLTFDGTTLRTQDRTPSTGGIEAHQLGLTIDGRQLLSSVSFTARPGTLTAVIGPSGAGKSTLIKMVGGVTQPTSGQVRFDGHDVHAEYASLRSRIGVVPQDDVVHRQLTVSQALNYAARLRLPADTGKADRKAVVDRVLDELQLTNHRDTRVDKLSGGQRKRASVAMELLTGPSLLILDEPTSGLDPALDREVMAMLRRLADAGRTVIVVTHSLTYLSMCDQVLLLAPGGKTAYAGPPGQVAATIGTNDWADIFAWVASNPDAAHAVFLQKNPAAAAPAAPASPPGPLGDPARTNTTRQVATLAARQIRLIFADRGYTAFLALLPFILGALTLVVQGSVGLGKASLDGGAPDEPNQLLSLMVIGTVFMGTALTVRDLVGERSIFRREQSVGLSAGAYLTAKIAVYSVAAVIQIAILTAIVVVVKGGPNQGSLVTSNPVWDLYLALALTAIVSAIVGLWLSSLARTSDWIMPMLVVILMSAIVFSGGLIPVTGRLGLNQVSYLLPARWGFAAGASSIDLMEADAANYIDDPLWRHQLSWWLLDVGVLVLIGIVATIVVLRRLRLPAGERKAGGRVVSTAVALVLIAAFLVGMSYLTRDGTSDRPAPASMPSVPTQGNAPPQKPVAAGDLAGLLIDAGAASTVVGASSMTPNGAVPLTDLNAATAAPPNCAGVVSPANTQAWAASNPTGIAGSELVSSDPNTTVTQYLLLYPDAEKAATAQSEHINFWQPCANTTVTLTPPGQPPTTVNVGNVSLVDGRPTAVLSMPGRSCQHVLEVASNVAIDVQACSPTETSHANEVVNKIAEKIH